MGEIPPIGPATSGQLAVVGILVSCRGAQPSRVVAYCWRVLAWMGGLADTGCVTSVPCTPLFAAERGREEAGGCAGRRTRERTTGNWKREHWGALHYRSVLAISYQPTRSGSCRMCAQWERQEPYTTAGLFTTTVPPSTKAHEECAVLSHAPAAFTVNHSARVLNRYRARNHQPAWSFSLRRT